MVTRMKRSLQSKLRFISLLEMKRRSATVQSHTQRVVFALAGSCDRCRVPLMHCSDDMTRRCVSHTQRVVFALAGSCDRCRVPLMHCSDDMTRRCVSHTQRVVFALAGSCDRCRVPFMHCSDDMTWRCVSHTQLASPADTSSPTVSPSRGYGPHN